MLIQSIYWYIGNIVSADISEYEISFMEQVRGKFRWPASEDKIWVTKSDIICTIPEPAATGKSRRLYDLSLDIRQQIETIYLGMSS